MALLYLPDLNKCDLNSLRSDVKEYHPTKGVPVVQDDDQDSTDLVKCVTALAETKKNGFQYELVLLGGLAGYLEPDQVHIPFRIFLRVYAVVNDNVGWVFDAHEILVDYAVLGLTYGLSRQRLVVIRQPSVHFKSLGLNRTHRMDQNFETDFNGANVGPETEYALKRRRSAQKAVINININGR
ncbi:hypothetical protein C8J56DRAFT_1171229 [Mycena floridula]|nr:hypothetical protein C8J56DRAFT_1171229 [Mycena floridula]